MKILADIHGYPPVHNSGAEWMAHHIFRHLVEYGHEVTILLNFNSYLGKVKGPYEFEGIKVVSDAERDRYYSESDIIFTHLDKTGKAYNTARKHGKVLYHIVHNNYDNVVIERMNGIPQYAIYNSRWVQEDRKAIQTAIRDSIVVHPPVYAKDYQIEHINNYITLININHNKGGKFLIELAKQMPDKKFMGVFGSYGHQAFDFKVKNIHYVENRPDIKYVYKRTRILLMPSVYESYGRTALEACASGIPVICNDTPGLKESLGNAGIFVHRGKEVNPSDVKAWANKIRELDNEKEYNKWSRRALRRSEEMNPEKELNKLLNFIEQH